MNIQSLPPELFIHIFTHVPYRADICSVSSWWYDLVMRCSIRLSKFPDLYHQTSISEHKIINKIIKSGDCHLFIRLCGKKRLDLNMACKGGHMELVQLMISLGATNWNGALYAACEVGNMEIVQLAISRGATDWDGGLYAACKRGHMELARLMISYGASDWHTGLYMACKRGHKEVAQLMISHGAIYCYCCSLRASDHLR